VKALTVKNPWAWWIVHGYKTSSGILYKDVENRTWKTDYRGKIFVHASKRPCDIQTSLEGVFTDMAFLKAIVYETAHYNGMSIGGVEITDCTRTPGSKWAEPGMGHWILKNFIPCAEPIPAKGKLGLWNYGNS
jgi:hypothetical protein